MLVGKKLGPFIIDKELGRGAMGTVYRAFYTKINQDVALKIIGTGLDSDPMALARFEREIEILRKLDHPNIVKIYKTGRLNKAPFYVMEYLEGESLEKVLQRRGRFNWEEVIPLGEQICSALQHAHEQGVVHRDLKPANIMMKPDGIAKLTDFGIAKAVHVEQLTATNCAIGTAAYMSPEQCRGERILTRKSDLYSLGVMFYELLTGRVPFMAESTLDMFMAHTSGKFERPSRLVLEIPIWLDTLVSQMLEKDPEKRPLDAATIAAALSQIQEKVMAQRSAGVDAVSTRMADRLRTTKKFDETDREAARIIKGGQARKKLQEERQPFYQTGWFQIVTIPIFLAAVGSFIYMMTRPPPADVLFDQAQELMTSTNREDWERARDGAIKDYLRHYPSKADEQAEKIRAWADRVDSIVRERQLLKRMKMQFSPDGEAESTARAAVHAEDVGELKSARKDWQSLFKYRDSKDEDLRPWGLVAANRLALLNKVDERDLDLYNEVEDMRNQFKEWQSENEQEKRAILAKRYEILGDAALANHHWQQLKDRYQKDADQRQWYLLAAKKVHDLKLKSGQVEADALKTRLEQIQKALDQARELIIVKPLKARGLCREVIDLYEESPDAEVRPLVKQARDQLKQLLGEG